MYALYEKNLTHPVWTRIGAALLEDTGQLTT